MNIERTNNIKSGEYFSIKDKLSYSALKVFSENRRAFYKQFILGETVEKDTNVAMQLGSITDCLLFTPEQFDEQFAIMNCKKPSGQLGYFCDSLYAKTLKYSKDGEVTVDFELIFKEALESCQKDGKFKGKSVEKVLEMFQEQDSDGFSAESYYTECRSVTNKTVIDLDLLNGAEKLVEQLKNSIFTGDIINDTCENCQSFNQMVVFYTIEGLEFKSMLDKIVVNHKEKTIQPYDLKTVYDGEIFGYQYYKMKYWIQAALYNEAVKQWAIDHNIENYKILPMNFIVADSSLKNEPLIWKVSENSLESAWEGQKTPVKIKGVRELITEIKWHSDNGIWTYPKEAAENGFMTINPYFNIEN